MKEKMRQELEYLMTVLPLYQKEVIIAQQRVQLNGDADSLSEYIRAISVANAKIELLEFIGRMLQESDTP